MGFKDVFNLAAGEIFGAGGPDWFAQQIQFSICMVTANPFFG